MIIVGLGKENRETAFVDMEKIFSSFSGYLFFPVSFFRSREYFRISVCDDRIFGHRTFSGKS